MNDFGSCLVSLETENAEIRMTNDEGMTNALMSNLGKTLIRHLSFGLHSSFVILVSVIRRLI